MKTMLLPASFYAKNRKSLQKSLKPKEVIVVTAHARLQKTADLTFFSQDRDFLYLTGINEPDWILVITTSEEFLIAPKLHKIELLFDGGIQSEGATKASGVKTVLEDKEGWKKLRDILKTAKEVQVAMHEDRLWFRTQPNPAPKKLVRKIKARTKAQIVSIHPQIHAMRAIKQPEELKLIKKAIKITGETLQDVRKNISSYKYEYEINADITAGFLRRGAAGHGYEPIIAGGINACTVHYIANDKPLKRKEVVLLDVGAEYGHYTADITRVMSLSSPTKLQQDVLRSVSRVVDSAIKMLKPGVKVADYFKQVDSWMADELISLGLIDTPTRENVRKYFPYGVSHLLGLDVHDVGAGSDAFMEGMVLTVEPGIHIPKEKIGVRIEENVLITKTGAQNLSKGIPRDL